MMSVDAVTESINNENSIMNRKLPLVYYEVISFSDLGSMTLRSSGCSCTLRWLKPFTSANRFGRAPYIPFKKKGLNYETSSRVQIAGRHNPTARGTGNFSSTAIKK